MLEKQNRNVNLTYVFLLSQAPNVPYYSAPESVSPMGSPYSFQASPRADSVDSPFSYGGVSYYQQSLSPDSVNVGSPIYHQVGANIRKQFSLLSNIRLFSSYNYMDQCLDSRCLTNILKERV